MSEHNHHDDIYISWVSFIQTEIHRRQKGGARGLSPLRMMPRRSYPSWSGAENRDKDRDTLIEQSL